MGTVNINLGEASKLNLILGQQLENAVTEVVFDFSDWQTAYGSGTLGLSVQRPGDDQPYAVVLTVSGTDATWSITDLDTAYKGVGEIQLTYTVGTVIKKSVVYKFTVYRSLGENGEYPSPGQTWQEEIEDEIADVKQDLNEHSSIISTNLMGVDVQQNLYEGSADWSGTWIANAPTHINLANILHDGYPVIVADGSWRKYYKFINVEANKKYTFQAWVKADNASNILMYYNEAGTASISGTGAKQFTNITNNKWTKISGTFTCTSAGTVMPYIVSGVSTNLYLAQFMLVEGESVFSLSEVINTVNEIGEDVSALEAKTNCIKEHINLLEGVSVTESYVYYPNSSTATSNNNGNIYAPIPIKSGETYYFRNLYAYFSTVIYADATTYPLSTSTSTAIDGSFTATNDGNIYITVSKAESNFILTTDLAMYNEEKVASYYSIDAEGIPRIFRIEKDGSGDFTTFVDGINEACKYMDSVVYVGAGEYDLLDELGSDYIQNPSSDKKGLVLKNRVHVICSSQTILKMNNTGTVLEYVSPINTGDYGCTLENATIIDNGVRYSIHDDRGWSGAIPYHNKFINCTLIHKNGMYGDCIGGGLGENCSVEIRGCYLEGDTNVERLAYYHANNHTGITNAKGHIIVADNYFADSGSFWVQKYGDSTEMSTALVSNNSFGSEPQITAGQNAQNNMRIVQWNNEIRS